MSMKDQISRITRLTELAGDAEGLAEMMAALKKMATIEDDTAAAEKRSGELKKMCAEEHAKLDGILADLATARAAGKLAAEEAAAKVKQAIKDANQEAERIAGEASVKAQGIIDQAERSAMAVAETGRAALADVNARAQAARDSAASEAAKAALAALTQRAALKVMEDAIVAANGELNRINAVLAEAREKLGIKG